MLKINEILDLDRTIAKELFEGREYPWQVLDGLKDFVWQLGRSLPEDEYEQVKEGVWIARDAAVFPSAYIAAPCIIDHEAEVRHCVFIRGSAIIGKGAIVGNSAELKNTLLFDGAQVPHYNYAGDSVLGYKAHMGAGAITSNVKGDKSLISVHAPEGDIPTGRKKFGAVLGDFAEIGCNSVLNPGSVICRRAQVYPCSCFRGVLEEDCIYKDKDNIVKRH